MLTLAFPIILTFHIYIINMDKRNRNLLIPLIQNTYITAVARCGLRAGENYE